MILIYFGLSYNQKRVNIIYDNWRIVEMKSLAFMRNLIGLLTLTTILPGAAAAQSEGEDYIKLLGSLAAIASPPNYTSIQGAGSGGVAPAGYVFASASGTTDETDGGVNGLDGSLTLGAGLGSFGGVETQAVVNITSTYPDADFANSGSFGLKLGTTMDTSDQPIKIGLSLNNLGGWGDSSGIDVTTILAASSNVTRYIANGNLSYAWTLGVKSTSGDSSGFAGLSLGLSDAVSFSTAYDTRLETLKLGVGMKVDEIISFALTANDPFDMGAAKGVTLTASFASKLF
ncbi:hypothetical protein N8338_00525 [Amylibacter sp.]|jgi:hypothetical protein|nr:hypothetical protein [Amylibacter sp.]